MRQESSYSCPEKIFVLDKPQQLLYDHHSIMNLAEHEWSIPHKPSLEEWINLRRAQTLKILRPRELYKAFGQIVKMTNDQHWRRQLNRGKTGGLQVMMRSHNRFECKRRLLKEKKNDHKILECGITLKQTETKPGK